MKKSKKNEMQLIRLAIVLLSIVIVIILAGVVFFLIPGTRTVDTVGETPSAVADNKAENSTQSGTSEATGELVSEISETSDTRADASETATETALQTESVSEIVTDAAVTDTDPAVATESVSETAETVPVTTHDYSNQTVVDQISIVAVGDNLVHKTIFNSCYDATTGTYNFDSIFEYVKPTIQAADIAIINQEVPAGGNSLGITGYPSFNAPQEILDCMVNVGFDVFTTATNHCLDKEFTGLVGTLNYLHTVYPSTLTTGTFATEAESVTTPIIECRGVKIAVLDYTYGMNGHTAEYSWSVNSMYDIDKIYADLLRAEADADFTIVCVHWGTEYSTGITDEQRNFAQFFADNGADVIIGSHPHVCEPLQTVTAADGRIVPVFYSLGNFLAWQNDWPRPEEGMAKLTLNVWDDGSVTIGYYGMDFMYMQTQAVSETTCSFKLYMLRDYDPNLLNYYNFFEKNYRFTYNEMLQFALTMDPTWSL